MRIAESILNKSEELAFRELESITRDNGLRLFAKTRLSDVLSKGRDRLVQSEFDFYTRAHVDFVITDVTSKPIMVVEYDGPFHSDPKQQLRDKIKDALCVDAGLGILRINANHLRTYSRGISILRWIVEVSELQKWFDEAQSRGEVPYDELFDPIMIYDDGRGMKWPYWLSAQFNDAMNSFLRKLDKGTPKGHAGVLGSDSAGNRHRLSFMWFGDRLIWAKTAIREHLVNFSNYDLLSEIADCELGLKLLKFRQGQLKPTSVAEFKPIHDAFYVKYNAHISHKWGYPFEQDWSEPLRRRA